MPPLSNRLRIALFGFIEGIVRQLVVLGLFPADYMATDHVGICEVGRLHFVSYFVQRVFHWKAPFFVGLQINYIHWPMVLVRHQQLLGTDQLKINIHHLSAFYCLPKEHLSASISVEKNCDAFSIKFSILLHQKYESIVKGSECITDVYVLLLEADGKCLLLEHFGINRFNSSNR